MATKSNLITEINTQLTAIITQAKVRLATALLVDQLYPTINEEIYSVSTESTTITAKTTTGLYYAIDFKKVGNTVFVSGSVRNSTGSIYSGTFATFVNSEYFIKTGKTILIGTDLGGNVSISSTSFACTSIGYEEKHSFNFTYTTND